MPRETKRTEKKRRRRRERAKDGETKNRSDGLEIERGDGGTGRRECSLKEFNAFSVICFLSCSGCFFFSFIKFTRRRLKPITEETGRVRMKRENESNVHPPPPSPPLPTRCPGNCASPVCEVGRGEQRSSRAG